MGPVVLEICAESGGNKKNKMVEVFFNLGRVHFATIGRKSVPKDQLSVALVACPVIGLLRIQ